MRIMDSFIIDKNKNKILVRMLALNDDNADLDTDLMQMINRRIPNNKNNNKTQSAHDDDDDGGDDDVPQLKNNKNEKPNTNKSEYAFIIAKDNYNNENYNCNTTTTTLATTKTKTTTTTTTTTTGSSLKALGLGFKDNLIIIMVSKTQQQKQQKQQQQLNLLKMFHESEQQSGIAVVVVDDDGFPSQVMMMMTMAIQMMTIDNDDEDDARHEEVKYTVNKKCDSIDYLKKSNLKAQLMENKNSYINDQIILNDIKCKDFRRADTINNYNNNNTYTKLDDLIELVSNEKRIMSAAGKRLRLRGGGEGSLTNATTGWGSPPNSAVGSTAASSWGAANPPPQWGQAGGASQPNAGARANSQQPGDAQKNPAVAAAAQQGQSNASQQAGQPPQAATGAAPGNNSQFPPLGSNSAVVGAAIPAAVAGAVAGAGQSNSSAAAKNQLEQLNTMREALFSQDGWGCQNVNQETNWDVPGSPEPPKDAPTPSYKLNNGTELWEAILRNGGVPPVAPVPKTQWNPKTPYGGTWGEDEENESPVWAGGNTPATPGWNQPTPGAAAPAWPGANAAPGGGGGAKVENEWPGASNAIAAWGNNAPPPSDVRSMLANRNDALRGIQGDPKGVSGRLAPPSLDAWNSGMQQGGHGMPINNMIGQPTASNGQWPVTGPKDMPSKPTNWVGEGTSPPRPTRPGLQGYDDGTSLWQNPPSRIPGNTPWKDMPDNGRGVNLQGRPGAGQPGVNPSSGGPIQPRIGPSGPVKPDAMWGGNRGAWDEHNPSWEDKIPGVGSGSGGWNDSMNSWNKPKPNPLGGQNWNDGLGDGLGSDWGHAAKANKTGNVGEMIRASKPFRALCELGIKKEDAELALRTTNNFDDALELLRTGMTGAADQWRRADDHPSAFDQHSNVPGRFPGGPQPSLPFPPNNSMGNLPNLGSAIPGGNPGSLNKLPQVPPNYMPPGAGGSFPGAGNSFPGSNNSLSGGGGGGGGGGGNTHPGQQPQSSQPSTHQLRMLVQQIQMAVQAGYLNQQILNQPLAPQTLVLLNQLLTCIKQLQQINPNNMRNMSNVQASLLTSKLQGQIKTLQGQITAQQQIYIKQAPSTPSTNDYLRSPTSDPMQTISNAFPELNLKSEPQYNTPSSISRLESAWKVPKENDSTDFSRAPGTTTKSTLSNSGNSILNLNNDGFRPWSSNPSARDGGWPDSANDADKNDWPSQNSPAFNELVVPEFKPGEPWKGTQQKSIEDDPSITPGSVARSPLSIAAKDTDIFSGTSKTSPTDIQPLNISSSTWSFTPSGQQNFSSFPSAKSANANTWSDSTPKTSMPSTAADLWSASKRGPPPGLGQSQKSGNSGGNGNNMSNNWMGLIGGNRAGAGGGGGGGGAANWQSSAASGGGGWSSSSSSSSWLLLKNLTAQIDGSTLRTLCMQHGPLQHFHLYLNHGIAICKYSSREEASKAQQALNNCVLGNTTICAESPSDGEVQSILQHLGAPSGGNGGNGPNSGNGNGNNAMSAGQSWRPPSQQGPTRTAGGSDTWGSNWTGSSGSNLWAPIDGATERGTPSNLNSFLPENLLGGELN